jgi:DNA-binding NarL/FixJ family response regulator
LNTIVRVFVADNHAVIREGVKRILATTTDMCVVGEASDVQELLVHVVTDPCDVVLLDSMLPDQNGLAALQALQHIQPRLPVVIFGQQQTYHEIMGVFKAGAAGYLTKECPPDELILALRKVGEGRHYVSPDVTEFLIQSIAHDAERPPHACLSERESQVMRLLAKGKRISMIATELGVNTKTVSTYRSRVLDKMCLQSTADLIQYAIRHGLVA